MKRAVPLLLFLAACTGVDNTLANKNRDDNDDQPVMVVEPAYLDFGGLGTGESAIQTFTIRNEGGIPLEISEVTLEGATGFRLLDTGTGDILPGESVSIDVEYTPTNLQDSAVIHVVGDDPFNEQDDVTLTGQWLLPVLQISPDPYEFGEVPFECLTGKILSLENIGSDTLVIDDILVMGDGYSLPSLPPLPLSLDPGESQPLQVLFEVPSEEVSTGQVWISSNDPAGAKVATQTGWGVEGDCEEVEVGEGEDVAITLEFTVEAGMADIAFELDTTSSMSGLALAMASEFRNIVGDLEDLFSDATYGVATYDDYAMSPFGSEGTDLPFILRQQQTSDASAVQRALSNEVAIHYGDDTPESTMEALYQGLTGKGYDQNCDGLYNDSALTDVLPFIATTDDPFGGAAGEAQDPDTEGTGTLGGFGFREGMLPIIVYATDAPLRDADSTDYMTPGGCPGDAGATDVVSAAIGLNARLIGVGVNLGSYESAFHQMEDLAEGTGSFADLDGDGSLEPAVVTWSGTSSDFRSSVVDAIEQLVAAMNYESIELVVADDTIGFVTSIDPAIYYDVRSGETVSFTVHLQGVLPSEDFDQANQLTFYLVGDGTTLLHTYTVTVIQTAG